MTKFTWHRFLNDPPETFPAPVSRYLNDLFRRGDRSDGLQLRNVRRLKELTDQLAKPNARHAWPEISMFWVLLYGVVQEVTEETRLLPEILKQEFDGDLERIKVEAEHKKASQLVHWYRQLGLRSGALLDGIGQNERVFIWLMRHENCHTRVSARGLRLNRNDELIERVLIFDHELSPHEIDGAFREIGSQFLSEHEAAQSFARRFAPGIGSLHEAFEALSILGYRETTPRPGRVDSLVSNIDTDSR